MDGKQEKRANKCLSKNYFKTNVLILLLDYVVEVADNRLSPRLRYTYKKGTRLLACRFLSLSRSISLRRTFFKKKWRILPVAVTSRRLLDIRVGQIEKGLIGALPFWLTTVTIHYLNNLFKDSSPSKRGQFVKNKTLGIVSNTFNESNLNRVSPGNWNAILSVKLSSSSGIPWLTNNRLRKNFRLSMARIFCILSILLGFHYFAKIRIFRHSTHLLHILEVFPALKRLTLFKSPISSWWRFWTPSWMRDQRSKEAFVSEITVSTVSPWVKKPTPSLGKGFQ